MQVSQQKHALHAQSATWVMDILTPCVLAVSMHDAIWRSHWSYGSQTLGHVSLIAITQYNTLSHLWPNHSTYTRYDSRHKHYRTSFKQCGTHLAAILCIFKPHLTIHSTADPEIPVQSANLHTVQCLPPPCTVQLWSVQHRTFAAYIRTAQYNHPMFHVALPGLLKHFHYTQQLSHIHALPLHRLPCLDEDANTITFVYTIYVHLCT